MIKTVAIVSLAAFSLAACGTQPGDPGDPIQVEIVIPSEAPVAWLGYDCDGVDFQISDLGIRLGESDDWDPAVSTSQAWGVTEACDWVAAQQEDQQ